MDMKWYFIGTGIALTAMFVGMAVDDWSKNTAKRDITVACYNSGKPDCEKLWGK
jgi:hypothetical protein